MAFNLADVLKDVSASDTGREQIEYIPLSHIDEDPNNFYQLTDVPALADNIALCGLQQPIRVRKKEDGRYIIVSGHRRRAALEMLVDDGYEKFREAPCIVEQDPVSPSLQQLRLIYANANTRKMSPAEISQQAEQVQDLLYQLKEEGYEFPGRMRDHVAEAMNISKSKLARLKVIREKLAACWVDAWKNSEIGESVAYSLSQMPKSWQTLIYADWGDKPDILYADTVEKIKRRFSCITELHCQHGLNLCEHSVVMMGKSCRDMLKGDYVQTCIGCCFECSLLQNCKNCCPEALGKQNEMKSVAKQANLDAKREQEERDRPGAEFAKMVWDRIGKARERSGCSVRDLVFARGESFYNEFCDDPKQQKMESGEGDYSPNSTLSFGYNLRACDVMHIVAVADALKCSVDYLLGRTDDRESHLSISVEERQVPNSGAIWNVGNPPKIGKYLVRISFGKYFDDRYETLMWNGFEWHDGSQIHEPEYDGDVLGWIPMPKEQEEA